MKRTMKTTLALLLTLLMLVGALPFAFAEGDPIHIASAEDFAAFVEGDASADAILDADIDLGEWTTAFADGYSGTFDGAGHTITYTITDAAANFQSLFHTLTGTIKNLTVTGTITVKGTRTGRNYHAGIVYQNNGLIDNCKSSMTMRCADTIAATKNVKYVGGIAAKNAGTIRNCIFDGTIENITTYGGGIVAENNGGSISGCVNNGSITVVNASGYAGGIVACVTAPDGNADMTIENCVNNGAVTGNAGDYSYVAGIIGQINIAGPQVTAGAKLHVVGCSNNGTLTAGNTADLIAVNTSEKYGFVPDIQEGTPVHEHTYDGGVVTTPATCGEDGVMTYTCTTCDENTEGHTKTEPIPATGKHTPGEWQINPDETSGAYYLYCTVCGQLLDADETGAVSFLNEAKQALSDHWFRLKPVFGKDTSVSEMVAAALEGYGYQGISVRVASAENPTDGTAAIADDGTITYFYADPNGSRFLWFASIPVTFTLEKGGKTVTYETTATINWDADKARNAIETFVASRVTADAIRGENESLAEATSELTLPKAVLNDNGEQILWSLVSWESSNPDVIRIDDSAQSSADTLFAPYRGILRRGIEDTAVTLTATFSFQRTSYDEEAITVEKTFDVTVKGTGDELKDAMQQELDEKYTADKLTYIGLKTPVDPENVTYDIQLLLPKTAGITNAQDYTFAVTSNDPDTVEILGARAWVYRPLPGEDAKAVTLTVEMQHKAYSGLSVQKEIPLTVAPITQAELDAQTALMERAKAALFDGFNNGANDSASNVTENLSAFYGVIEDENGNLQWQYTYKDPTDAGIQAVAIDPFHPSERWDRFQSSDPDVISHENLLVTPQKENTTVTIYACLSSTAFERYAERYPDDSRFDKLYRQPVSVEVTVPGTDPTPDEPETPDTPADSSETLCPLCHKQHTGFFGKIIAFFHHLLWKIETFFASKNVQIPHLFPYDQLHR